ncbi:MAG: glycoside hydrolase [Rubrivivax sp.]|nr:MAG: glycoside hydrolase [Rubrivivax sp.]
MKKALLSLCLVGLAHAQAKGGLTLNDKGYLAMQGLDVTAFADIYPDGHQTGVTVIQHGSRVAANGDLRLEISPGQWSPVPVGGKQEVDKKANRVTQTLSYPDPGKDRKGFNPIAYPDLKFSYKVSVTPLQGSAFKVTVDLEKPLPAEWIGKVGFNFELFPGELFGKAFLMDHQAGIFPRHPVGPMVEKAGEFIPAPLASGRQLVVAPDTDRQRLTIENLGAGTLELWDGRGNHNNGWYIVRSAIPAGATANAVEWVVTPNVIPGWKYEPVLQVSQVGYAPGQRKKLVIEQDALDRRADDVSLYRLTAAGRQLVRKTKPAPWGKFLRYHYLNLDFSDVREPGMYVFAYRGKSSHAFKIGADVFDRGVWQPTLEYFLPVQMCHMRVNEKYRVWHGLDHMDDARMAPVNLNHYDGYVSGPSTLTKFQPGDRVPGLNVGNWHDAGDYDMRIESTMKTVWLLSAMVEEFGLAYDATTIDQARHLVEIHQPDGKNDALQQIEHGLLSVLSGYKAMGRTFRGIIDVNLRQYVMLGDAASQTDGLPYNPALKPGEVKNDHSGEPDDRWVFTEDNPDREVDTAAGLAAASRVLRSYNPEMSRDALAAAIDLYAQAAQRAKRVPGRAWALAELILATQDKRYVDELVGLRDEVVRHIAQAGWPVGRVLKHIDDQAFIDAIAAAVGQHQEEVRARARTESPYGVPYKPDIWGAGWTIQEFGVRQYFFHKGWPQLATTDAIHDALHFVLGVHPGANTASFASGVGANSTTVAYGVNRADWSHIPGGVVSGTALIRPDLPEFKIWPFFWQQTEYVMGGGETNFMFLTLAVQAASKGR